MTDRFSWRTAAKIAWRESRASAVKFGFVILAVAVGVGSLTGVRGFSSAFQTMLMREARVLMGADLTVRVFVMPSADQEAAIEDLRRRGVGETRITETLTMVSSPKAGAPVLVSAKAVDPAVYPFYGSITLAPAARIAEALTSDSVALSEDLMVRLNVVAGETVRLGGEDFRVAGTVVGEPDRMTGSLNIGPRVLMARDGLARTPLLGPGSRAAQRFLFKLGAPGAPDVETARQALVKAFPDALVVDFRETHPRITTGLKRSTMFLSLVSLIALIVGALGVGTAMHSHLQQKLDSIAIMKCLGARSRQIMRIYLIQTIGLGLAGGLLGISVGATVQLAFPHLISRYFQIQPGFLWDWPSILQGLIAGLLCTLLFTLPPLLAIRKIRPNLILRREMADARASWRSRWRDNKASIATALVILLGVGLLAAWLAGGTWKEAARLGGYFTGGLTVSLVALAAVASLLLIAMRRAVKFRRIPVNWRHGMANLYRPGNQARAVLVSLGIGVMFTVTIYLVQMTILDDIVASAPPGLPNVYLIDVQPSQKDAVLALLKSQPGLEREPQLFPSVAARVTAIGGVPVEKLDFKSRRVPRTTSVSFSASVPEATKILRGQWWGRTAPGLVALSKWAADNLKAEPGVDLDFEISGQTVRAKVAAVYESENLRSRPAYDYTFTPETLEGMPVIYNGGLRMKADTVAGLQRKVFERFPTISVINVADVVQTVQEVVDQIALVIRFISAFAILAGVVILASSVAGTRFRRIREVVILKTLGGTRQRIGRIFSAEFLILGAVAGLMGALLASGFSNLVLIKFFEAEWRFDPGSAIVAVVGSALIANAAGWAASARILGQKPLEVLRSE